jgi:hypothetical protein
MTSLRLALSIILILAAAPLRADDTPKSNSPYIDELKKEIQDRDAQEGKKQDTESYTEKIKKQLEKKDQEKNEKPYIDQLKEENPELNKKTDQGGYTDQERSKLPPEKQGGAIEALQQGKSELHPRKRGQITGAFGFKMTVVSHRNIDGGDHQARPFEDVYGTGFAPELQFFYEWQPWHSEFWGNVGLIGSLGLAYFDGFGKFPFEVPIGCAPPATVPCNKGNFPLDAQTKFNFIEIPAFAGLDYRFNLLHYLRPFVMAGPLVLPFVEARDDNKPSAKGFSKGFLASAGVAILLDGISPDSAWNLYMEHGIQHFYLTVDYTKITTVASTVSFDVSQANVGIAFEF